MNGRELVVILCDDYYDAEEAYDIFKEWFQRHEDWTLARYYDNENGLTTNDGFAYVFIDSQLLNFFTRLTESIVYVDQFFDEIMTDEYYEREEYERWKEEHDKYARYVGC